jgi:hypothetical protein
MKRSAWRLAVAAVLFTAWIGYLAFLARTTTRPTVLDRPQFLVADLYVVADVGTERFWPAYPVVVAAPGGGAAASAMLQMSPTTSDLPGEVVTVRKHVWAANPADRQRQKIYIKNLHKCGPAHGWKDPGEYILALSHTTDGPDVFQVTALPKTPGFRGSLGLSQTLLIGSPIYRAMPSTLQQLEKLTAEYHPGS